MPKIKIKNIPNRTAGRICDIGFCKNCVFYSGEKRNKCGFHRIDPETIFDLPVDLFPTNREWLESLSDEDLAAFYTLGIQLKDNSYINLYRVAMSFTSSQQGIKEWLSQPCKYLMEEE